VSANVIFQINYDSDYWIPWKNLLWQRAVNFLCMRSSSLESVIVTEFQATEAYVGLDLTKVKYCISRLYMAEKGNVIVQKIIRINQIQLNFYL
jgi:hypothetical protein